MSQIDRSLPLIMILHDANTDLEAIQHLLSQKQVRFDTAPSDESGLKKLVYSNCDGVIFPDNPQSRLLQLLRDMLGGKLLPGNFPVFLSSEAKLSIANNHGLGSLDIFSGFDAEKCIDKVTKYRSKRTVTRSFLGWATVVLMFVLLFLGLKGSKVFLPPGELETQVEKLKVNDPADVYLRLLGPTAKLKDRIALFNNLTSHPDFYFLPLDLSMFLISRRNETQNYLDRVESLLTIPATLKVVSVEEIEATLLKITQLKDRFPKKWETTEAWAFLLEKETLNKQLLKELKSFYSDFNKRNEDFNQLSKFSEKQKIKGFDWKPWMETAAVFLQDPWPDSSYFALSTNIPEILEMRLADHRNREKIRFLKSLLHYLSIPADLLLQDFLFKTDLPTKMLQMLEKEVPNWRSDLSLVNLPQSQKDVFQTIASDLNTQVISLLRTRILFMLGDQQTWPTSKSKIINDPMLTDLGLFIQPVSLLANAVEPKPVENLISFLGMDTIGLKCNSVKIKLHEKLVLLLTDKPVLNITIENSSGVTAMFSTNLVLSPDKIFVQGTDLGFDHAYKWFDKVKAEIGLKDGSKLVWDKPQLEIFGWSSLLTDGKVLGGSPTADKLIASNLLFEPKLIALPSLLFKPDN